MNILYNTIVLESFTSFYVTYDCVTMTVIYNGYVTVCDIILTFFKSTIYYIGHNSSLCLQKELYIEYQYSNLFYAVTQHKELLRN